MTLHSALAIAFVALSLVGCGGSAKRLDSGEPTAIRPVTHVKQVDVRLSDEAKKKWADNTLFDSAALKDTIARTLHAAKLVDANTTDTMEVEVTSMYVRGAFGAIMFGVLAGADNITGNVRVLGADGKPVKSFEVSASYAFGGLVGGLDSIRLNYLYEKFAELARDQIRDSGKN
jgi:hypothetical protein